MVFCLRLFLGFGTPDPVDWVCANLSVLLQQVWYLKSEAKRSVRSVVVTTRFHFVLNEPHSFGLS